MIVIDFLWNIAASYYHHENGYYFCYTGIVCYALYFLVCSFIEGMAEEKSSFEEMIPTFFLGVIIAIFFALIAGILPLLIFILGILYLVFSIMFKWGKNYKKLQSYKKDETSDYVKEIARLEEVIKQFEKSK